MPGAVKDPWNETRIDFGKEASNSATHLVLIALNVVTVMMSKGNAKNLAGWLHICSLQLPNQFSPQSTCRIKSTLNHTREVQYLQTLNISQYAMDQGPSDL